MRRVLLPAVALALCVGSGCARDEPRPSGITERWLQAVGDQGRDGLLDDAKERADRYGTAAAARRVVPADPEADERHFSDLEVGKAVIAGDEARVPFRLTARLDGGDTEERAGTAVLARAADGSWRVTEVTDRGPGEEVPSEGGDLPARASGGQWLVAILIGVGAIAGSVALIEAQPRRERASG